MAAAEVANMSGETNIPHAATPNIGIGSVQKLRNMPDFVAVLPTSIPVMTRMIVVAADLPHDGDDTLPTTSIACGVADIIRRCSATTVSSSSDVASKPDWRVIDVIRIGQSYAFLRKIGQSPNKFGNPFTYLYIWLGRLNMILH